MPGSYTWSGKVCVRCGTARTSNLCDGLPVCSPCQKNTRVRAKAAGEPQRTCPVDSGAMLKEIILDVVVDRCPKCHGVFLDGGELEALRKAMQQQQKVGFDNGFSLGLTLGMITF